MMDIENNRGSPEDMVFEYTGDGCSVPKDVIGVRFKEGLQKIGDGAFFYCTSLESITLPSTLVEICGDAFRRCHNLRVVIFNDGLQKIGASSFYDCSSLESIKLPSTLTDIDNYAFAHCNNLRDIELNEELQKIGICSFYNCASIESITLPPTLVEIGAYVFNGCSNLREVELNGVPKFIKREAFRNCNALERFIFSTISYRLENIIQTRHWEELEDKVNEVRGVVQWESNELFVSRPTQNNWDDIRRDLDKITRLVSYYELREATSTFELAIWKLKLDQAYATNTNHIIRAAYRMEVPGPVKDTMLQYLYHNI